MLHRLVRLVLTLAVCSMAIPLQAGEPKLDTSRGDKMIAEYFRTETARLTRNSLADVKTKADWQRLRGEYHKQLREMLGLLPWPEKTPLKPVVTGNAEHEEFTVENLHFQSRPGLYVTGNLYVPKKRKGKLPTILYVCGHGRVKIDGVSYGNKVHYQHHGAWFARNGYVCLTIDTLQLGEIEGIHHGTYNQGMFWWNAGYTSAGVEAWNCIRALDYLETRPEVDATRIGVTGRSGGGAYSWWAAALDERIKVAVPVAGIASLQNHVVDGCVEGHCDCMFMVNTYQWDFPALAALVAPRPLLISNTDKDRIFPLDGVVDVYFKTRRVYDLLGAAGKLGLQITEGPHKDTQNLRVHAFHWFNEHLKGQKPSPLIEVAAVPFFKPEQLKVFLVGKLPKDEKNSQIQETFVPKAGAANVPTDETEWKAQREGWMQALKTKAFRGWPGSDSEFRTEKSLNIGTKLPATHEDVAFSEYVFTSHENIRLPLYVVRRAGLKPEELDLVVLNVLDEDGWTEFLQTMRPGFAAQLKAERPTPADEKAFAQLQGMLKSSKWGMAYVPPRGIGPTAWDQSQRKQTQHRRRFVLLGQTQDGMRVWDAVRAAQALRGVDGMKNVPLWLQGQGDAAGIALYASLFIENVKRVDLHNLNRSHRDGPIFLNVLRYLDIPQAVAMAADRSQVVIYQDEKTGWEYPQAVAKALEWKDKQLQIRVVGGAAKKGG